MRAFNIWGIHKLKLRWHQCLAPSYRARYLGSWMKETIPLKRIMSYSNENC